MVIIHSFWTWINKISIISIINVIQDVTSYNLKAQAEEKDDIFGGF